MYNKIKILVKNQWFVGAFYFMLSSITITVFWKAIVSFFVSVWVLLDSKTEVSIWILILLSFAPISIIVVTKWIYNDRYTGFKKKVNKSLYLEYTEDKLGGAYYQWTYIADSQNNYIPFGIKRICSICKCEVVNQKCPICNKITVYVGEKTPLERESLIRYNIKTKYGVRLPNSLKGMN